MKKRKAIRPNTYVKFDFEHVDPTWGRSNSELNGKTLIYLGEIKNMPQHGIFFNADSPHQLMLGYHIEDFVELTMDEV